MSIAIPPALPRRWRTRSSSSTKSSSPSSSSTEIHQLPDPTRLLKIGADVFPRLKIVATGSSTLAAAKKFRDALTGRKRVVCLRPVLFSEIGRLWRGCKFEHRLLRGGLPPALLAATPNPEFYSEWLDSHFARDVQELFGIAKRIGFTALLQVLLRQSGGLLDITKLAGLTALSRPTVMHYLEVCETTLTVRLVRPYHAGKRGNGPTSPRPTPSTPGSSATRGAGIICAPRIAARSGNIWCWTRS